MLEVRTTTTDVNSFFGNSLNILKLPRLKADMCIQPSQSRVFNPRSEYQVDRSQSHGYPDQ